MARLTADIMAVLRCPITGSPLVQKDGELVSTAPDAQGNLLHYVLEEGIPVLLPHAASTGTGPAANEG